MNAKPTMGTMPKGSLRAPVTKLITPICRGLIRMGVTANAITIFGALATVSTALLTFPSGHFLLGSALITFFVLFDLLDGTIARLSENGSTVKGALLDSTLDRISDSAVLLGILWYFMKSTNPMSAIVLISLVAGYLVSYIKARAEAVDIVCNGGLAERTERLIILLLSTALCGLGIESALVIGLWILAGASIFTAGQRMLIVMRASK